MNFTDWLGNGTVSYSAQSADGARDDTNNNNTGSTTEFPPMSIASRPCDDSFTSPSPETTKLPGSLDALFYIMIVLMFYAFSIVVLMVKYVRRERDEANLRNYYNEFVSRDKFQSPQYRNRQIMRMFCKGPRKDDLLQRGVEDVKSSSSAGVKKLSKRKNQTDSKCYNEVSTSRDGFTLVGVKSQICKNSFFGRKFCNKQLCSKCVSESTPAIDWGDGRANSVCRNKQKDLTEGSFCQRSYYDVNSKKKKQKDFEDSNYILERDNSIFFPILECDSDVENDDDFKQQMISARKWNNENVLVHVNRDAGATGIPSSCSLEISRLLRNMPPLDVASTSNDMDTLDGLSNLNSEAGSQSLLNYSASIRGTNSICGGQSKDSPAVINKSGSGDDRLKDLSDFLSERTSLLSCTLSIDDGEDDDVMTNPSSAKHHPNGLSLASSSNGRIKEDVRSNGKSILNSLSKSFSGDEGEKKQFKRDITNLTEDSGVFKNLKYFLRSFSKDGTVKGYETLNLLPRETYFGPGSPQSFFGTDHRLKVLTKREQGSVYAEMDNVEKDVVDDDNDDDDERENFGSRWGFTYDTEDEVPSEGGGSSSFGDYSMGEPSESQVIDISKPLARRQLDSVTKDIISRAFIGLADTQPELQNQTNVDLATNNEQGRRETKV